MENLSDLTELAKLVRRVLDEHERRVRAVLDEHEARILALEDEKPPARYSLAESVAARRRVVTTLRQSGLSLAQISAATGASVRTIERDLGEVGLLRSTSKNGRVEA